VLLILLNYVNSELLALLTRNQHFFTFVTLSLSFLITVPNEGRTFCVQIISLQCDALKSKVSSLDSQLEKIAGQLKAEEAKCRELDNKLKIKENEWNIDKAALEEKAKAVGLT